MSDYSDVPRVAIQVSQGVVVASIQVDLDEDVRARFQDDLLRRVHETDSAGVILDVSGLDTLDSEEFAALRRMTTMAGLLGADVVLAGLGPGIVSSLIEAGADVDGVLAAIDLDAAFELLAGRRRPEGEPPADDESREDTRVSEGDAPTGAPWTLQEES